MESQTSYPSKDDIWRLQSQMKNIYAIQAEHSDRLARLERRQGDDTRARPWGGSAGFPSGLGEPGYNPAAEAFKNFDQEQQGLLGSSTIDNDDEPRRGASRANSVRFDETAMHGHLTRSSGDFLPFRSNSAFSLPLTERSLSHKSDGRQSSAGQSTYSARSNSIGYETSRILSQRTSSPLVPLGPPPGFFILGPAPCIIKCWLSTHFSKDTLLYAVCCTGSYTSILDSRLIDQLNVKDQVVKGEGGVEKIKLAVYLPEATVQQSSSRSSSPAQPQVPALTVNFTIQHSDPEDKSIQIFLGSDVLREHNTDILFSQDKLTLYDDDSNKLAMPLVRPDDDALFKNIFTTTVPLQTEESNLAKKLAVTEARNVDMSDTEKSPSSPAKVDSEMEKLPIEPSSGIRALKTVLMNFNHGQQKLSAERSQDGHESEPGSPSPVGYKPRAERRQLYGPSSRQGSSNNIWWRRDSNPAKDPSGSSGFERSNRTRNMKVLKPTRTGSSSITKPISNLQTAPDSVNSRFPENNQKTFHGSDGENQIYRHPSGRSSSGESVSQSKESQISTSKTRSANPVGGASAFSWMNPGQEKKAASTAWAE